MTAPRPAITVAVPGTCGELIQGWWDEWAEPVLVSCPIARYSRITVQVWPEQPGLATSMPDALKTRQAAHLALNHLGHSTWGVNVSRVSQLRPGRGMASSTADVVGVMAGLARAAEQPLSEGELARLACQVEPSDSTMFPGLTLLAYRGSARFCSLGLPPLLPLLMLDPGCTVDTLAYNARLDLRAVRALAATTQAAQALLSCGLRQADPAAIGAAATLSAFSYQQVSHSPLLEQAKPWVEATGALGLVRAHSGSVIGLLYPPETDVTGPRRWLAARFNGVVTPTHLIGGGCQILTG